MLVSSGTYIKIIQGLLRDARMSTALDLYSQSIDGSKFDAQKDKALAINLKPQLTVKDCR